MSDVGPTKGRLYLAGAASLWMTIGAAPAGVLAALVPESGTSNKAAPPASAAIGRESVAQAPEQITFSIADAAGPAGDRLPINITVPRTVDAAYAYLMFKGLPPGFSLSAGTRRTESWMVPVGAVPNLTIAAPAGFQGTVQIDVMLVPGQRGAAERDSMFVRIEPSAATASPSPATPSQPAVEVATAFSSPPAAAIAPSEVPARAVSDLSAADAALLARGNALLATGDVAAARLIYGRLAKKGIAAGALAMAQTYDPEQLRALKVTGLKPDIQSAQDWYGRAAELGDALAAKRLETLIGAAKP